MSSTINIVQSFGAFEESSRDYSGAVATASAAHVAPGRSPGDGGQMTIPMTFAYLEAYAAARSCLGALANVSGFDDSCLYERLLIELGGDGLSLELLLASALKL